MCLSHSWVLDQLDRFRNRIRFFVSHPGQRVRRFEIRAHSNYFECRLVPMEDHSSLIDSKILIRSRWELWDALMHVSAQYPHTQGVKWRFGFYCPGGLHSNGCPHPAPCLTEYEPHDVVCPLRSCQGSLFPLEDKHKSWFMVCVVSAIKI